MQYVLSEYDLCKMERERVKGKQKYNDRWRNWWASSGELNIVVVIASNSCDLEAAIYLCLGTLIPEIPSFSGELLLLGLVLVSISIGRELKRTDEQLGTVKNRESNWDDDRGKGRGVVICRDMSSSSSSSSEKRNVCHHYFFLILLWQLILFWTRNKYFLLSF